MPQNTRLTKQEIGSVNAYQELELTQREITKKPRRYQKAIGNVLPKGKKCKKAKQIGPLDKLSEFL